MKKFLMLTAFLTLAALTCNFPGLEQGKSTSGTITPTTTPPFASTNTPPPSPTKSPLSLLPPTPLPTITRIPEPTATTPMSACQHSFGGRIKKGEKGKVIVFQVTVRDQPGGPNSGRRINVLARGRIFTVMKEPVCANGMVYLYIISDNGIEGWIAEGDFENYFVAPVK